MAACRRIYSLLMGALDSRCWMISPATSGQDVRLGGGPSSIRQFLRADLVDFLHLAIQPMVLGRGVSLWEGLGDIHQRFDIHSIATPDGQVHQFRNRRTRCPKTLALPPGRADVPYTHENI